MDPSSAPALLPDIVVRQDDLYDHQSSPRVTAEDDRSFLERHAQFGDGKLYVFGTGIDNGDGTEDIIQRIYLQGGRFTDRLAGRFVFHPSHNHIHVEDWCEYRCARCCRTTAWVPSSLRDKRRASASSTSWSTTAPFPNYTSRGQFFSVQFDDARTFGGMDGHLRQDAGRPNIDITGVPAGTYWLESQADPNNAFLERDETNNAARIKLTIGGGGAIDPDAYEPNNSAAAVAARGVGIPSSPNWVRATRSARSRGLVPRRQRRRRLPLLRHRYGYARRFRPIDFSGADLSLYLQDAAGAPLDSSKTTASFERIELNGRSAGGTTSSLARRRRSRWRRIRSPSIRPPTKRPRST